jgi:hypothetical protein
MSSIIYFIKYLIEQKRKQNSDIIGWIESFLCMFKNY